MQFNDYERKSINESALLLRALAHKLRISIINFIDINQPVQVYRIHSELGLEQSITSQHLKILRESGIVTTTRKGKQIFYEVNQKKLTHASVLVADFDKRTLAERKRKK